MAPAALGTSPQYHKRVPRTNHSKQLYPAEINPLRTRGKANALSTITNWLFNFVVVMITPVMIDRIGWGTYLFFAVVNASFLPFMYVPPSWHIFRR
jgi:hypothetical protein